MEEINERLLEMAGNEEAKYYYYITNLDGNDIFDKGLPVKNLYNIESFMEFQKEELVDFVKVLENTTKADASVVLIGTYEDSIEKVIREMTDAEKYIAKWNYPEQPEYIIDIEHIIGIYDLKEKELSLNERADVIGNFYSM